MTMTRPRVLFAILSMVVAASSSGCDQPSPAAASETADDDLAARVKALEDLLPSQSHLMADVGDHFTNLWFAGRSRNWPLADFYFGETRQHLHWAVRRIPIRKDLQGKDVNLVNILDAFEKSQLAQLKKTIDSKDQSAFEIQYRESLTACYSCHKAADKPYLRPQVPAEPASKIINFDPSARWPL
jgi:cytochrome c553